MSQPLSGGQNANRAVSPVIGVILMVAITVILAAVIGAFVLEIGDQQETAPSSSFDSEQSLRYYEDGTTSSCGADGGPQCTTNLTTIKINHAGGDTIPIDSVELRTAGSNFAMAFEEGFGNGYLYVRPQPDIFESAGTNTPPEFTSGESWTLASHGIPENEDHDPEDYDKPSKDLRDGLPLAFVHNSFNPDGGEPNMFPFLGYGTDGSYDEDNGFLEYEQGETVNVVWKASSGGKTQTLYKYTVQ